MCVYTQKFSGVVVFILFWVDGYRISEDPRLYYGGL